MHTSCLSQARRITLWIAALIGVMFLTGCELTITNLTSETLRENPSNIYTLTLRVTPKANDIVESSIRPRIVIDGQSFAMNKSSLGDDLYEFDYQIPAGRDEARYYFLVNYQFQTNSGVLSSREAYTDLYNLKLTRRYVLSLEAIRGPIGARISLLGRGFTPQDVVYFDNTPARTVYESPTSISFFVPGVEANKNYKVMLSGGSGNSNAGTFRVDPADVQIAPSSLSLRTGGSQTLTFTIPNMAPPGGLLLDVTTDIPESIVMPEVVVPAGSTMTTITVEGGKPGNGSLFLKGYGNGEVTIPVTVTAK